MKKLLCLLTVSTALLQAGESSWKELAKQVTWRGTEPGYCLKTKIMCNAVCEDPCCGYYDTSYGCSEFYLRAMQHIKKYVTDHSLVLNGIPLSQHPNSKQIYGEVSIPYSFNGGECCIFSLFKCSTILSVSSLLGAECCALEPSSAFNAGMLTAALLSCPVLLCSHIEASNIERRIPLEGQGEGPKKDN